MPRIEEIIELHKYIMYLQKFSFWKWDKKNKILSQNIDNGMLIDTEFDMKTKNYFTIKILKNNI